MALTILLTLILIGLSILVWCKWEERKWLDDGEYVHLSKPKREFIEKQLAEARAAVDDKMPDDASFDYYRKRGAHELEKLQQAMEYPVFDDSSPLRRHTVKKKPKAMEAKIVKKPKKHIQ